MKLGTDNYFCVTTEFSPNSLVNGTGQFVISREVQENPRAIPGLFRNIQQIAHHLHMTPRVNGVENPH